MNQHADPLLRMSYAPLSTCNWLSLLFLHPKKNCHLVNPKLEYLLCMIVLFLPKKVYYMVLFRSYTFVITITTSGDSFFLSLVTFCSFGSRLLCSIEILLLPFQEPRGWVCS